MKITAVNADISAGQFRISASIEGAHEKELWFAVDEKFASYSSLNADAFLVGLLVPAQEAGEELASDVPASALLIDNLNRRAIPALCAFSSQYKAIKVSAPTAGERHETNNRVAATGFSGGIDSFSTLIDYQHEACGELQVKTLLFCNFGQFGEDASWFQRDAAIARRTADEKNLEFIVVDSNLHRFYKSKFAKTHSIRNCVAPFLLSNRISYYFYSSGYQIKDTAYNRSDIATIDAILLPVLQSEYTRVLGAGGHLSRVQKTELVADEPSAQRNLFVCLRSDYWDGARYNCSRCEKCIRTMLTLHIMGRLDEFSAVFDVKYFNRNKELFFIGLFGAPDDPLTTEIRELMHHCNYDLSFGTRFLARLAKLARPLAPPALQWRFKRNWPVVFHREVKSLFEARTER